MAHTLCSGKWYLHLRGGSPDMGKSLARCSVDFFTSANSDNRLGQDAHYLFYAFSSLPLILPTQDSAGRPQGPTWLPLIFLLFV